MMTRFINNILFRLKNSSTKLGKKVVISRKTKVGKNCIIGNYARLSKNVTLGDNVRVGEFSVLHNMTIDDNTMLESGIRMPGTGKGRVIIGKECYVGVNNIFDTSDNITIGDFVHIAGATTSLWCHSTAQMCLHSIPLNDSKRDKYRPTAPISIEDSVYVGGCCTIYPGVKIGHHSIITPNSAVTKDVASYTMVGGVPAKVIKKINIVS